MSRGTHRKPGTTNPRLRRAIAGLSLVAAAATTGVIAAAELTTATSADTAWGAPDTETDPSVATGTDVTPLDTAWG